MSFWDTLKPAVRTPAVVAATASADQLLISMQWDDGKSTRVAARTLRQFCPCAECVEEWSGNRTFDQDRIAADMKVTGFSTVGNYAMSFIFSDTHRLGIYTWSTLRELSEARPA